jgi:oligopeptide/dipeptide ABC transporter ATP-binding protein
MGEVLLEVKSLKKYYPITKGFLRKVIGQVKAVDDVSFLIHEGETFGLVGESGCGKTTIGKTILRLTEATAGEVLFKGKDILRMNKKELRDERRHIQIVFQDPYGSLNPRMNVLETLSEPILWHKLSPVYSVKQRVFTLLDMVELPSDSIYKYPHEFSGGQRQRIVIARALASNPRLIVCDEPVSALDVSVQAQILNLLKRLQKEIGVAYLFIAHGMAVVKHISNRVGVMYFGGLVEMADADEIFEKCRHPYTQALMSAIPIPDPEIKRRGTILQGEIPNPMNPLDGCRFHPRCIHAKERCKNEFPVLREISPNHFTACHFYDKENKICI